MRQYGPDRKAANTVQRLVRRIRTECPYHFLDEFGGTPPAKDEQGCPLPSSTNRVVTWTTDEKKRRNTTRGYTTGLRSPRLEDIPGNRVPWPPASLQAGRHMGTGRGHGTHFGSQVTHQAGDVGNQSAAISTKPLHRLLGT